MECIGQLFAVLDLKKKSTIDEKTLVLQDKNL